MTSNSGFVPEQSRALLAWTGNPTQIVEVSRACLDVADAVITATKAKTMLRKAHAILAEADRF